MIAPRLANPEGKLRRTIEIQGHKKKEPIDERGRSLWADGVPRTGCFNRRRYPSDQTIDEET
eukprot:5588663-Alexandrium_andersonii.AAC.1